MAQELFHVLLVAIPIANIILGASIILVCFWKNEQGIKLIAHFIGIMFILSLFGAWVTHIVTMIQMASETGSAIALLLVGALFAPLGVVTEFVYGSGTHGFNKTA